MKHKKQTIKENSEDLEFQDTIKNLKKEHQKGNNSIMLFALKKAGLIK
jgi:hypothetical protein